MATNKSYSLEGIVVDCIDYKESSKIIKIFTKEKGLISVMARGAKRPKSKMQNLTSVYTKALFSLRETNDFFYLIEGKLIEVNLELRSDIKKLYTAATCTDIIIKSLIDNEDDYQIYSLYDKTLEYVIKNYRVAITLSMFLIKYISMLGYKPVLTQCSICGKTQLKEFGFSIEYGGLTCLDHQVPYSYINKEELSYIYSLLYSKYEDSIDIKTIKKEKELLMLIMTFVIDKISISKPKVFEALISILYNWL